MENAFKEIINQVVKPIMKSAGFKKKTLNFYKNENGLVYLINIQKSHGNTSQELGFYINCCIHSNNIEEVLKEETITQPKEYECHFRKRIESISNNASEKFVIKHDTDLSVLKKQITLSINDVLSYFESIKDTNSFVLHMSKEGTLKQEEVFRYCVKKELTIEAKNIVDLCKKNIDEKRWNNFFKQQFMAILKEEKAVFTIDFDN